MESIVLQLLEEVLLQIYCRYSDSESLVQLVIAGLRNDLSGLGILARCPGPIAGMVIKGAHRPRKCL